MAVGYACLALCVSHSDFKNIRLSNITEDKVKEIIDYNLISLENLIDYNILNEVKLFRVSSSLIPFGSILDKYFDWKSYIKERLAAIGQKALNNNMRLTMHPGQYTVINSLSEEVVKNSIDELVYHADILDLLGTDFTSKMVLHIGGIYNDKNESIKRFIKNFELLPLNVKKRLIIENDEKSYNIKDVLYISSQINIPVVFDNLHHFINSPDVEYSEGYWIEKSGETWKNCDGKQKIHYSQQDPNKNIGAHSFTIDHNIFLDFYNKLSNKDIDIMLEVKDKNVSALKIINCINQSIKINQLEKTWAKYKYLVLEHSQNKYNEIRQLLKNKDSVDVIHFYNLIEEALLIESTINQKVNALEHVWSYFKDNDKYKKIFKTKIDNFIIGKATLQSLKNYLLKIALESNEEYLIESYYFDYLN